MDGLTEAKAFDLWYTGRSATLPNAGKVIDNSSFPCVTSCVCRYSHPLKMDDTIEQQRPLKTDDRATLSKLMKLVVVVAPNASSDSLNASVFLAAWIPRVATSDFASGPLRIMTPAAAKGMAQVAVGVVAVAALGISAVDLSSALIGMEGFL